MSGPGGPGQRAVRQMDHQAEQGGDGPASIPETGEPRVDAALELLAELPGLPVSAHAAVFERIHAELTDVLGELDPESAGTDG